jgi:hypothetical protein
MTRYLAGVLTVIAVGVLLVAYGLINPRVPVEASPFAPVAQGVPMQPGVAAGAPQAPGGAAYAPAVPVPAYAAPTIYGQPATSAQPFMYTPPAGYSQPVAYTPPMTGVSLPQAVEAPQGLEAPRPVRTVNTVPVRQAPRTVYVDREPKRDWKKTAAIIGGSSAAGAGLGAIFGGKKGALIGAAIGGGASTIYETTKK